MRSVASDLTDRDSANRFDYLLIVSISGMNFRLGDWSEYELRPNSREAVAQLPDGDPLVAVSRTGEGNCASRSGLSVQVRTQWLTERLKSQFV